MSARPLIGLSVNVPENGGAKELIAALLLVRDAGVRLLSKDLAWRDLEPAPGAYDFRPVEEFTRGLPMLGCRGYVLLKTLDTNNRALPADLANKPFDDPTVRARFAALLRALAPKLTERVDDVSLGNECDIYLGEHPEETEPFAGFAEHGRRTLRALHPNLPVGVTTTVGGLRARPRLVRRLHRAMDVVPMTYYPLGERFRLLPISDVASAFAQMTQAAGGRPLLVQEIGCPAAPRLGGSEDAQAAFVDAVFDAMERHAAGIAFVNFFLLYDFGDKWVDTFLRYYRLPDPNFRAYLATLGLRRSDGTPRLAWTRFERRARAWTKAR